MDRKPELAADRMTLSREYPMQVHHLKSALLVCLAGFIGSCLVGFAVYGSDVLDPMSAAFQFVTSGAISGALCAALVSRSRKALEAVALVAVVVFLGAMRPSTGARILRDLVYVPTLAVSCWLAWRASARMGVIRYVHILVWGIVFALSHAAIFSMLTAANQVPFQAQGVMEAARIGGLVGIGVGLGVVVAELRAGASFGKPSRVAG